MTAFATGAAGAAAGAGIMVELFDGVDSVADPEVERVEQVMLWPESSLQSQFHGPLPETLPAWPLAQRSFSGASKGASSEAVPQPTKASAPPASTGGTEDCFSSSAFSSGSGFSASGAVVTAAAGAAAGAGASVEDLDSDFDLDAGTGTGGGVDVACSSGAVQPSVSPPSLPLQFQDHGPVPIIFEALPLLQRFCDGADVIAIPFAEPHEPLILIGAVQETDAPPFNPLQLHVQGPPPLTLEA